METSDHFDGLVLWPKGQCLGSIELGRIPADDPPRLRGSVSPPPGGICKGIRQGTIVGKEQKPFRIGIEPTHGKFPEIALGKERIDGWFAPFIASGTDQPFGFVDHPNPDGGFLQQGIFAGDSVDGGIDPGKWVTDDSVVDPDLAIDNEFPCHPRDPIPNLEKARCSWTRWPGLERGFIKGIPHKGRNR